MESITDTYNEKLLEDFEVQLSRAIENHVTYDEIGLSSRKFKRRQHRTSILDFTESSSAKKNKKAIERKTSIKSKHTTMSPDLQTKAHASLNSLQGQDGDLAIHTTVLGLTLAWSSSCCQ